MSVPQVIAHRGDPVAHVENTLPAIAHAVADGCGIIEVDARLDREGVPVLLHDYTLDRLWGISAAVDAFSAKELRSLVPANLGDDALCDSHRVAHVGVPSLVDALGAVGEGVLLVDFPDEPRGHGGACARAVAGTIAALATGHGPEGVGATPELKKAAQRAQFTGGLEAMREIRAVIPDAIIRLTHPVDRMPDVDDVRDLQPYAWNPPYEMCTLEAIEKAKNLGLETTCWTVDNVDDARELARRGVYSITTNRPAVLLIALRDGGSV